MVYQMNPCSEKLGHGCNFLNRRQKFPNKGQNLWNFGQQLGKLCKF